MPNRFKTKIQRRIVIAFSLALLAMLEMTYYTYRNTWLSNQSAIAVSHTNEVLYKIEQVSSSAALVEASARGYVLTEDDKYIEQFNKAGTQAEIDVRKLQQLVADNPMQEERAVRLGAEVESKKRFMNSAVEASKVKPFEAQNMVASNQGKYIMDNIEFWVNQMKNEEKTLLQQRITESQSALKNTMFTILSSSLFMLFFGAWAFYSIRRDNQRRIIAEAQLTDSEKKYRTIIEDAGDVVYTSDYKGEFTFINARARELTGYPAEELVGKPFTSIIAPEWIEPAQKFYFKQFNDRVSTTLFEFQILTKQGQRKWVEQTVVLISREDLVDQFHCIVRDITARKELETQLVEAKEKAEEATKAKEMFLASISHEIRTPMNGVTGMANLLAQTQLNPEQKEYNDAIKDSAQRLLVVINDVLDLSKINAGKVSLNPAPFNVREVVKSNYMTLSSKAKEKNIALNIKVEDNVPEAVVGDGVRLSQVLWNLSGNAVKFTEKGEVDLSVMVKDVDKEKVHLKFVVKDTGIGIAKERLQHIFEPFVQADKKITHKYGGTGLGLDIAEKIVELHGGKIEVASELGKGSEFSFIIGYDKYYSAPSISQNQDKPKDLNGVNILFVEDNKVNQTVGTRTLGKWGATVDIAVNGKIAIEMLAVKNYDLILMDLQMPEMDGMETTEYIRKQMQPPASLTPVIAMTAAAFMGEYDKCIAAGMNDYLSKPFNPDDLYNKIRNQLDKKASALV
jgi:PAS domain S-box-containing protein